MSDDQTSPTIHPDNSSPGDVQQPEHSQNNHNTESNVNNDTHDSNNTHKKENKGTHENNSSSNNNIVRRERPSRACTARSAARLYAAAAAEADAVAAERKRKAAAKKDRLSAPKEESPPPSPQQLQCSRIVTTLVGEPEPSQLPRWSIRSMWELASILNFLNVFRPLLNIKVEFSAEEFETALITPNSTLSDIHIPLLKAIPPIMRMALGHNTWVTVLCRKLRDWWHWVADGELPIVASHGAEVEAYKTLDPGVRVLILKALCDIRVEQDDIRSYIDSSIKHAVHLSAFRKERIGGDSHGISYWYEDDPVVGHRLYREIRKVELKKGKGKTVQPIPNSAYHWEAIATNLDEFQDVSEKLFSSRNRTEASVGKKLKIDMLPEIEKVHKKKERLLKKQHREALLLHNNIINVDGLAAGRSLRDRKPVTYTFDDYDRSINEAIKITKRKQSSPEPNMKREDVKPDDSANGTWVGPSQIHLNASFSMPKSPDYDDETDDDHKDGPLDRSDRRRQRPQRYSEKEFVEAVSDNEADFDSDDDIVGEAVYDEEYLRKRKQMKKMSSSSEGDEEYHWDEENAEEDEEEEEEEDEDSLSISEESDEPQRFKKLPGRTRRETKLNSVDELQSGLRRSQRATNNRINYRQYEMTESETESMKPGKSNASDEHSDQSDKTQFSAGSEESEEYDSDQEMKIDRPTEEQPVMLEQEEPKQLPPLPEKVKSPGQDEGIQKRRFLDLNELAPSSGFDDCPNSMMKDEDADNF